MWRVEGEEWDSEQTFPFGGHPGGSTATDRIHFKRNAGNGFYHSLRSFQNDSKQKPLKSVALGVDARKAHPPPAGENRSLGDKKPFGKK